MSSATPTEYIFELVLHPFDFSISPSRVDGKNLIEEAAALKAGYDEQCNADPPKRSLAAQRESVQALNFFQRQIARYEVRKAAKEAAKEAERKDKEREQAYSKRQKAIEDERQKRENLQREINDGSRRRLVTIAMTCLKLVPNSNKVRIQSIKKGETWCTTAWEGDEMVDDNVLGTTGRDNKCCGSVILSLDELSRALHAEWNAKVLRHQGISIQGIVTGGTVMGW